MIGFHNYDQWKTASPYDDDPDWIDEAYKCLKTGNPYDDGDEYIDQLLIVIEGLLEVLQEEGIIEDGGLIE